MHFNEPYNLARRFASLDHLSGGRGHRTFTGTPVQVAGTIQHWFEHRAADGFNVMPAVLPSGLEVFVAEVLPILRGRGPFRTEYGGTTLHEHYGLPGPPTSTRSPGPPRPPERLSA